MCKPIGSAQSHHDFETRTQTREGPGTEGPACNSTEGIATPGGARGQITGHPGGGVAAFSAAWGAGCGQLGAGAPGFAIPPHGLTGAAGAEPAATDPSKENPFSRAGWLAGWSPRGERRKERKERRRNTHQAPGRLSDDLFG